MKKYDDIVVGSGISGLTMALFLAINGRKVLLIEKAPRIGGSLAVFYREGVPFDTGFHFTGGLQDGGLFHDMLSALGLYDLIQPVFMSEDNANTFFFESEHRVFEIPYGFSRIRERLKGYFPKETGAVDQYFDRVLKVCADTPSMDLRNLATNQHHIDEDFQSLQQVLDGLTGDQILKALLSGFAMCYGTKPSEVSFANHSRICLGLYESVARLAGGGGALIEAFRKRFLDLDVDIRCGCSIAEMADISNQRVGKFVLSTGEEVECENCVLTVHPKEILKLMPEGTMGRAFISRVSSFEASSGFFALFATLDPGAAGRDSGNSIVSFFPHTDINRLLEPECRNSSALVLIRSTEEINGTTRTSISALETSFPEHVAEWKESRRGQRPEAYQDYKKQHTGEILERIFRLFPDYRERLRVLDAASVLTFRDYLNSPDGSAYGVKQKLGQYNLFGKLPLRNLYAAGQSSLLPGIIGAMMSSFIVGRSVIKEDKYAEFVGRHLCS
jgi:phytoene dehydrogenase-like protein